VTAVAIALATLGAGCFAVAAWLQHAAVRTVTGGGTGVRLAGLVRLARAPRWWGGLLLTGTGAALHACALALAALVVVQPVGVLAIAMTTVLATRAGGGRPSRATGAAVAASTVGVGLFVALAARTGTGGAVADTADSRATLLTLGAVAGIGALAAMSRGRLRCLAFATGAGAAYGLVSVLVHITAQRLAVAPTVPVLAVAGGLAAMLTGGWFVQHAYAAGPPHVVVACLTVVDPVLGVGVGVGLLHEGTAAGPWTTAGQLGAAALAIAGVVALARENHPVRGTHPSPEETPVTSIPTAISRTPAGRLRIVIGADTFPPDVNGAARFGAQLASGLAGRGHDVHVLCPATAAHQGGEVRTDVMDGVTVHRVPSRRTPFHPSFRVCPPWQARRAAARLLHDLEPDLVHVQAHFLIGRALARTATRQGVAVVATNHFMPENLFGHARVPRWLRSTAARLAWRDLCRVYRDVPAVTAPTPTAVRLLRDNGLPQRATAVSCGIDLDRFPPPSRDERTAQDGHTVLFVGRLDEEKRVDELLRAAALLGADVPVRVEIVGDGSCRTAWRNLADRLGLADRVRFRGFVDEPALIDAYTRCDVFCMPGVAELQSLATMEAMAAGKPVVAADAMALPHLVRPGQNGWLYRPGDVPALAYGLSRLLTEPGALARMGAASRRIVADHAIDRSLDTFEALYRRVLRQPATGADCPVAPAPALAGRAAR
jgi:glycosyltransferase involved in cell wall biosynthesis